MSVSPLLDLILSKKSFMRFVFKIVTQTLPEISAKPTSASNLSFSLADPSKLMRLLFSYLMFRPKSMKSYMVSAKRLYNLLSESSVCNLEAVCVAVGSISTDRRRIVRVIRIVRRHSSYFNLYRRKDMGTS
jgi:hypothetical protein